MASRCRRCGRFKRSDGILLCAECGSPGQLQQDATIRPRTIGDASPASRDNPPTSSTQRAALGTGKQKLVVTVDTGKWVNDRQAFATREIVKDKAADFYRQERIDPATGETTFRKRGRFKDQRMHGRASHQPTSARADDDRSAGQPDG
jgi:hypothetical protein